MIYEFRTYTTQIGAAPKLAKLSAEIGRDIRGDDYGKLEAYFLTEVGPLNQVMHLWSYEDLNHRADRRAALAANDRWRNEYLSVARPLMVRQDNRILMAAKPLTPPSGEGHIYEYRAYRAKVGMAAGWLKKFLEIQPVREKYSKNVGIFHTDAGQPNEISHLWAYDSFEHRMKARGATMQDPEWQAFLKHGPESLDEMTSTLLIPGPHSPMK
jgi:hypothetical protein